MSFIRQWDIRTTKDLIEEGVIEIGDGYRAKNSELGKEGLPFARAGNINNGFHFEDADILAGENVLKAGNKISHPGDVVFTSKGTVGRFAFVRFSTPRFVYSPQLCYWRVNRSDVIEPRFLFHWMQGAEFMHQVHQVKGLTDMADYVNLADQRRMHISLPPLPIQRKIAAILSAYDDLIENNMQRIALLEQMAQAIYREWFVEYRFPGHEQTRMVPSALGDVPEGWEVVKLEDTTSFINRGVSPKYNDDAPGIIINQKCIRNQRLSLVEARRHETKFSENKLLEFGDVLINSTGIGTLGRVAQVYEHLKNCTVDSHVSIVRPSSKKSIDYLGIALFTKQNYFEKMGIGSTGQTELGRQAIANTDIVMPPVKVQERFSNTIRPLRDDGVALEKQNSNLRRARDLLLPKLISGEINVSTLEIVGSIDEDIALPES